MTPNEVFQQLVQKLYSTHLHFHLSKTPYSAQILIRKKFLNDKQDPLSTSTASTFSNEEVCTLNVKISELQKKVQDYSEVIDILENKLSEAESQVLKNYEQKKIEIKTFKNSIEKSDILARNLKKALEAEQKVVKEKEKLIQKLELKNENLSNNYRSMKTELNRVKNENKKLVKNNKQRSLSQNGLVKTHETTTLDPQKSDHEEDSNQNNLPSKSSQSSPSLRSPATPARLSPTTTPPCTPPIATSCSAAANEGFCLHSPQCTTRQPRPPPPDKCTILVHHGSKYHEHMDNQIGVPHQLGVTHEYCMRIDYENYGCEECKWFKKWGELHGYPDINPWSFKEHRQPLTYL